METIELSSLEKFFEGKGNAILIVIISAVLGYIAIKLTVLLVKRLLLVSKMDNALVSFFLTALRVILEIALLLFCLQKLSVPLTSMIAILSALGVAIGLAIQDSIANVANGLVMIGTRPFKVGEYVQIGDEEGTIEELRLMNTVLCTKDNRRLILPNKMVFNSKILNFHANPLRRLDLVFQVDYATDIDKALVVVKKAIRSCDNILSSPAPLVEFTQANSSSLDIETRIWISSTNYWPSYFEVQKTVYDALVANGISIPFPQVTVSERTPGKKRKKVSSVQTTVAGSQSGRIELIEPKASPSPAKTADRKVPDSPSGPTIAKSMAQKPKAPKPSKTTVAGNTSGKGGSK